MMKHLKEKTLGMWENLYKFMVHTDRGRHDSICRGGSSILQWVGIWHSQLLGRRYLSRTRTDNGS